MKNVMQQVVKEEVEKSLYVLDEKINLKKNLLIKQYENCVLTMLDDICILQKDKKLLSLSVIWILLSRIAIDNQDFCYAVFVYDEKTDIKFPITLSNIDVSFFYEELQNIKQISFSFCKKYVKENFILPEVEQESYQYLKYFNMYFVNLMREVFELNKIKEKINSIDTAEHFMVLQGEIGNKPYCIYEKKYKGESL